jgi:putative flippase GtrA
MADAHRQLLRFAAVGTAGFVADVLVLYLGLALGLGYYAGRAVSFLAAVWVTWQLNRRYTFARPSGRSAWAEWSRYLVAMLGGGVVNYLAYTAVVLLLPGLPGLPILSVAAGSIAGLAINFVSAKFFVFRH